MFNLMTLEKIIEHGLISLEIPFSGPDLESLRQYVNELTRWNDRINLVGLKDPEAVATELLFDAFFLYGYVKGSESVLDMGSGAGILAIPIAILDRRIQVFSIDRTLKKIQFQRHIKRTLKLGNFYPVYGRIESVDHLNVQGLVAKAFGNITDILTKGGEHIMIGCHAFLLKGKAQEPEDVDGFTLEHVIPYTLPGSTKSRTLFIYRRREKP